MNELVKVLPSVLGVMVGGLITFSIQFYMSNRQRKWDEEKMKRDNHNKMEAQKFAAFSKILHLDAKYNILDWDIHHGFQFQTRKYLEQIRPLLYEIYHLLDESIISEIESIEGIHGRQRAYEEAEEGDNELLVKYYQEILKIIKKQCEDWRESTKNKK